MPIKAEEHEEASYGVIRNYMDNMLDTLNLNSTLGRNFLAALINDIIVSPSQEKGIRVIPKTKKTSRGSSHSPEVHGVKQAAYGSV